MYQQGQFQQQQPVQQQQVVSTPQQKPQTYTWFGAKAMFQISYRKGDDFCMFEWRPAIGDKQYDKNRRIIAKMSKEEIALISHGLFQYCLFGEQAFVALTQRLGNQKQSIDFFHRGTKGDTIISVGVYQGRLYLSVKRGNEKLTIGIPLNLVYDYYLTLTAIHSEMVRTYIYKGKSLQPQQQLQQNGNIQTAPQQPNNIMQQPANPTPQQVNSQVQQQPQSIQSAPSEQQVVDVVEGIPELPWE